MHLKIDATAATSAIPSEFTSNISIQLGCCGCCNFTLRCVLGKRHKPFTSHLFLLGPIPFLTFWGCILFLGVYHGMSRSVFPKPYWSKHPAVRTTITPPSPSLKWPLGRDGIQPEIQKLCSINMTRTYITYIYICIYIFIYIYTHIWYNLT